MHNIVFRICTTENREKSKKKKHGILNILELIMNVPITFDDCGNVYIRTHCVCPKNGATPLILVGLPVFFIMGFSLLRALEFFAFRKMEMPETEIHPLCGCESRSYTEKSPFHL
jgi:hypothetical protein